MSERMTEREQMVERMTRAILDVIGWRGVPFTQKDAEDAARAALREVEAGLPERR